MPAGVIFTSHSKSPQTTQKAASPQEEACSPATWV